MAKRKRHIHRARPRVAPQRRAAPGTPPGSLTVDPRAPAPRLTVICYGPDAVEEHAVATVAALAPLLSAHPVTWVNVDGLGDIEVIHALGQLFSLHPLALEDVVNTHQRPKVEHYDSAEFVTVKQMQLGARLETEQLSLFLGDGFVLTFQEREGDCLDPVRRRIRSATGRIRGAGADYLAYAILDAVTDHYFPLLESLGAHIERLETEVFGAVGPRTLSDAHNARRELLAVRHALWPLREVYNAFLRDPDLCVTDTTRVFFRDCYDHTIQLIDITETYRELTAGLMDVYLSQVSQRMNEIMKVLTIIATIFIPLSFIAGLYGMNFSTESPWNMPELGWRFGYPFALGLMLCVALVLLLFFQRRGWLGGARALGELARDPAD